MPRNPILLAALLLLSLAGFQQARAQAEYDRKFEVGGQFSLLRRTYSITQSFDACLNLLCPPQLTIEDGNDKNEPGFGGRFGYNFYRYFAVEAEANFFPRDRATEGGGKIQVVGGAKVGKRFRSVGLFGKARPGFVRFSQGDYRFGTGGCPAVFPPPIGCFQPEAKTNFALDLGGVVELYPSKRTIVRFDVGDTMIFFGDRLVALSDRNNPARVFVFPQASETRHNLQFSAGFGFRF